MNVLRRFPAMFHSTALSAVLSSTAVAAAAGLLIVQSTTLADDPQASATTDLRNTVSTEGTQASPTDAARVRTVKKANQWTSSPRSWKQKSRPESASAIQLASGIRSAPPAGDLAPVSTPGTEDSSETTASPSPIDDAPPTTATPPALSAKEQLKRAIEEQRRNLQNSAQPDAVSNSAAVALPDAALNTEGIDSASSPVRGQRGPVPKRSTIPAEPGAENDSIEQAKAARFLLLKIQLEQLRDQLRASESQQSQIEKNSSTEPVDESGSSSPPPAAQQPAPTDDSQIGDTQKPDASSENLQSQSVAGAQPPAAEKTVADSPQAPSGFSAMPQNAVVNGPIDRLGLANNLYAIGEYLLAMEMYEQTDRSELTAQQQIWTEYQIANCLRRIGRKAEASNRYRRLAAQPEAGWLSSQSSWWVDVLEKSRQLENALQDTNPGPATDPRISSAQHSKDPAAKPKESKHGNQSH